MPGTQVDIAKLATVTAAVGMSVVFFALFVLSVYMNLFKRFVNNLEEKRKSVPAPAPAPAKEAQKAGGEPKRDQNVETVAALTAVALHLEGFAAGAECELAAAIGTALFLQGAALPTPALHHPGSFGSQLNWGMAGRLQSHRQRHQAGVRTPGKTSGQG